jgi:hypothetical protein
MITVRVIRASVGNRVFGHYWLVKSVISTMPVLNRSIVFFGDLFGYGRQLPSVEFWKRFSRRH